MNSRSLIERSVASFASFSRVPPHSRHWLATSADVTGTNNNNSRRVQQQQQLAFQARPVYTLPLGSSRRRICTTRGSSMSEAELKTEPKTASPIADNLEAVRKRVEEVAEEGGSGKPLPRLVAVSKTKPLEDLQEAYAAGQRIFGENYVSHPVMLALAGGVQCARRVEVDVSVPPQACTAVIHARPADIMTVDRTVDLLHCTRPVVVSSPQIHVMGAATNYFGNVYYYYCRHVDVVEPASTVVDDVELLGLDAENAIQPLLVSCPPFHL